MKRQRLHNFATIVSMGLCILFLGVWRFSSLGYVSHRWIVTANDFYVLHVQHGIIKLDHTVCSLRNLPPEMQRKYSVWAMPHGFHIEWNRECKSVLGLGIRNQPLVFSMGSALVVATTHGQSLPMWLPTAIAALLPLHRALKWYRRYRLGPNACGGCRYDLTGNTSGVCPECGIAVPAKTEIIA